MGSISTMHVTMLALVLVGVLLFVVSATFSMKPDSLSTSSSSMEAIEEQRSSNDNNNLIPYNQERFLRRYFDVAEPETKDGRSLNEASNGSSSAGLEDMSKLLNEATLIRGPANNRIVAFIGMLDSQPVLGFDQWSWPQGEEDFEFVFHSFHTEEKDKHTEFLVDLGDGSGTKHRVRHGSALKVAYDSMGSKLFSIQPANNGHSSSRHGRTLKSNKKGTISEFVVLPASLRAPPAHEIWTESSPRATAFAYVYRSSATGGVGRPLRKPLLIIEGFDPENLNPSNQIYTKLADTEENAWNLLQQNGWDIIIVDFQKGALALQDNASALRLIIDRVRANKHPRAQLVVLGVSAGGLVSRYCLTWMEANHLEHDVALYISFDTPHWGATLSLGNQYYLRFAASVKQVREVIQTVLNSPAAKQLLLYHESTDQGSTPRTLGVLFGRDRVSRTVRVGPHPDHDAFLAELKALGNYPSKPRRVAFSNGNGNGAAQNYTAGQGLLHLRVRFTGLEVVLDSFVLGSQPGVIFKGFIDPKIPKVQSYYERVYTASGLPFETAPGGQLSFTQTVVKMVEAIRFLDGGWFALQNRIDPNKECFVPTLSAIDSVDRSNPFLPGRAAQTPFHATYFAPDNTNEEHVTVTADKTKQLLNELSPFNNFTDSPTSTPTLSPTVTTNKPTFSPTRSPTFSPSRTPTTSPENEPSQIVKKIDEILRRLDRLARAVHRNCAKEN